MNLACGRCGLANPTSHRFCGRCGTPLPPSPANRQAPPVADTTVARPATLPAASPPTGPPGGLPTRAARSIEPLMPSPPSRVATTEPPAPRPPDPEQAMAKPRAAVSSAVTTVLAALAIVVALAALGLVAGLSVR